MPVKPITTEPGHSLPPDGPHTITLHYPGWANALRFRDGDMTILTQLRSVYPRFGPFGLVRQLSVAIGKRLGIPETNGVLVFTDPAVFTEHKEHSLSEHRKENKLSEGDLAFKVVDIHGIRLYLVIYHVEKTKGVIGLWQNAGIGISTRAAEELLRHVDGDDFRIVEWSGDISNVPPPTYLPESKAHELLRRRISDLLHRAPVEPEKVKVTPDDVYLYQSGMAAIYRLNTALTQRDPGTILALGAVFHSTWHLFEESLGGMKHFGQYTPEELEEYLDAHYRGGKTISYAFLEFPSNPILVSADLKQLRRIADKYSFPLVVDDTVGSFANVDVLPAADLIITSLTKSFSGYADLLAGSVVLNPLSKFYTPALKPAFTTAFHNEFFEGDAQKLLSNSDDYLTRTITLNRNAASLARYLSNHQATSSSASPIREVLYPLTSPTLPNYQSFLRRPTPDFTPGYGCLLSVDFWTLDAAKAFYDNLQVHCGPHLGAHRTLALPFNATTFGADPVQAAYHAAYGARGTQLRVSVGLEDEGELLEVFGEALRRAEEVYRTGEGVVEGEEEEARAGEVLGEAGAASGASEVEVTAVAEEVAANYEA
ncbi:hypothetical protein VPNG_07673 [Cytospora leucostoma]|uniref:Cystathionine gamma-synthase n=1 Tax=Cytospora leucostoma TaxID=1230097 RepID=A0A423WF38_9PEZI|nr:hypothetical protein VPNG_07673 [Cytospora leucostoma]